VLLAFTGFYSVLLGFYGFESIEIGFITWFDWALCFIIDLNRVSLSFTGFL